MNADASGVDRRFELHGAEAIVAALDWLNIESVGKRWGKWHLDGTWYGSPAGGGDYTGVGGQTYFFRTQAYDFAQNYEPAIPEYDAYTTVEAKPPYSWVAPLPEFTARGFPVFWRGEDVGGSEVENYDVQYRDGLTGNWINWQTATTSKTAGFTGTTGHTYSFRSRAKDKAQNLEAWASGDGDTTTTLYSWVISGTVMDNRDTPLLGVLTGLELGEVSAS